MLIFKHQTNEDSEIESEMTVEIIINKDDKKIVNNDIWDMFWDQITRADYIDCALAKWGLHIDNLQCEVKSYQDDKCKVCLLFDLTYIDIKNYQQYPSNLCLVCGFHCYQNNNYFCSICKDKNYNVNMLLQQQQEHRQKQQAEIMMDIVKHRNLLSTITDISNLSNKVNTDFNPTMVLLIDNVEVDSINYDFYIKYVKN